jgi:transglutaminase-like putative cysteine protease
LEKTVFNNHNRSNIYDAPEFLFVNVDRNSRYHAVQQLVRPWEVEHLLNRNPSPWVVMNLPPFAEQVAQWLRGEYAARRFAYQSDPSGFDVWYSPATTLRRRQGDCEDWTLVVVSMLLAGGVSSAVCVGSVPGGGHAWVEGVDASGHFLIEATSGEFMRYRPAQYNLEYFIEPNDSLRRVA